MSRVDVQRASHRSSADVSGQSRMLGIS